MIKYYKKALFLCIIFLCVSLLFTQKSVLKINSSYNIAPQLSLDYVLEDAGWLIKLNNLEEIGYGGNFKDVHIDVGYTFNVDVLEVNDTWGVDFEVSNTTESAKDYMTNDRFIFEFLKFIYYPYVECERLLDEGFNVEEINLGPEISHWFFLEPTDEIWSFLGNLTSTDYHNSLPFASLYDYNLQAALETKNQQKIFDLYMQGKFERKLNDTSVQFDHSIKFVWNETSGVLLGYRIASYFSGKFYNNIITEQLDVICKKSLYVLEKFKFITALFPGFNFIIVLSVLIIFTIVNVQLIKRIRKNNF